MDDSCLQFEIAYLDAFVNPFSGKPITRECCAICNAILPLPGEYPMMVVREEPDAKLFDCTNDPGSTDERGMPRVMQDGIRILRPVCWHHAKTRPPDHEPREGPSRPQNGGKQ